MSIFKYGFIIWGFFVCYAGVFLAYAAWMTIKNRQDDLQGGAREEGGR